MQIKRREVLLPLCACGCGERVEKFGNKYINHHNPPWNKNQTDIYSKETRRRISLTQGGAGILKEDMPPKLCECGCGKYITNGKRFINYHQNRGRIQSEEANKKRSEALMGHIAYNLGMPAWNAGLTKETDERVKPHTEEWKQYKSESQIGRIITWGDKISEVKKGVPNPVLKEAWDDPEFRKAHSGENTSNWQGGISSNPYSQEFNNKLREQIRQRDNYKCQMCFIPQDELDRKLAIHHIDYDKENCSPDNLISLCSTCHAKTSSKNDREKWQLFFNKKKLLEVNND
jgi:hypothetical protein